MYIYICIFVHICMYMYICVYIYTCIKYINKEPTNRSHPIRYVEVCVVKRRMYGSHGEIDSERREGGKKEIERERERERERASERE